MAGFGAPVTDISGCFLPCDRNQDFALNFAYKNVTDSTSPSLLTDSMSCLVHNFLISSSLITALSAEALSPLITSSRYNGYCKLYAGLFKTQSRKDREWSKL